MKYNLAEAKKEGLTTLLTFGGAYSNHIYATAAAAKELNLNSVGIIRGEEISTLSKTLQFAQEQGMHVHFISREAYRQKTEEEFISQLKKQFGDFYLIPEGGTNTLAIQGVEEFAQRLKTEMEVDYVCCACGTGGTLAGIIRAMPEKHVIGFSSLKGNFLSEEVRRLLGEEFIGERGLSPSLRPSDTPLPRERGRGEGEKNWEVITDYHVGGYAKHTPELLTFIKNFEGEFSIPLEHVYTGKLFFGLFDLIQKEYFTKGSRILVLHTGGLQGKLKQR